ncbi:MAG: hypothetical protein JO333_04095 [Verrucomicrobia bacterium]|nr:hypothetical protein [Verrucomicrobiota bacterium]
MRKKRLLLLAGITAAALVFNALTTEEATQAGQYVAIPKDHVELADRIPVDFNSFGLLNEPAPLSKTGQEPVRREVSPES